MIWSEIVINHKFSFYVVKVQKSLQRLPDSCSAVCPSVPPVRAVRCVTLRWPVHLCLGVWLYSGCGHDGHADVDLHPLLRSIPKCGRSHWPGCRRRPGTGENNWVDGSGQLYADICLCSLQGLQLHHYRPFSMYVPIKVTRGGNWRWNRQKQHQSKKNLVFDLPAINLWKKTTQTSFAFTQIYRVMSCVILKDTL